ncbi:MAG: DUF4389 domain-containing protein [Ilumatobacteraceae bacterium]|nr:DUF4389 domain-containing protein [Ilumatobacteraceae bacterium]
MTETIPTPERDYYVVDSPYEVARWRPLVNWLLYIPHAVISYALRSLAGVVAVIYWLVLLFTGKLNRGLYGVMTLYVRYDARATGFLVGFSETYPPFDFRTGGADNDAYPPITLNLPEPAETGSRKLALNVLLAIPHYVVFIFFGIAAAAVAIAGWFAVLFTGAWPKGMRDFLVRVSNYYYRVWLYAAMVETEYPKFGLSPA